MDVEVFDDEQDLARRAADLIAAALLGAVAARRTAACAFSGGATPAPLLAELARLELPWRAVTVFQVDERVAPDGHQDRNAVMLERELVSPTGVAWVPMPVTAPDLDAAAAAYAGRLREQCGDPPVLDAVHLGLGDDGHTASLVPGDPVLAVRDADVALSGPYQGRRRMTLTYPPLDRAARVVWQVVGASKAAAVRTLVDRGDSPAARVAPDRAVLLCDGPAAARLSR